MWAWLRQKAGAQKASWGGWSTQERFGGTIWHFESTPLPRQPPPPLAYTDPKSLSVYEESHYPATDNKTRLTTLARISLEDISSAGSWLLWDTAAGVVQEAKWAIGHGHKNVPLRD